VSLALPRYKCRLWRLPCQPKQDPTITEEMPQGYGPVAQAFPPHRSLEQAGKIKLPRAFYGTIEGSLDFPEMLHSEAII